MKTLVVGEHVKLVECARIRVSDRSELVFFVLDINGALSPQTKEFIDDLLAAVKPKRPVQQVFAAGHFICAF